MAEGKNPDGTFAPGNGYSRGRSKRNSPGYLLMRRIQEKLAEVRELDGEIVSRLDGMIEGLIDIFENTENNVPDRLTAAKLLWDRGFGRVREMPPPTEDAEERQPIKLLDIESADAE